MQARGRYVSSLLYVNACTPQQYCCSCCCSRFRPSLFPIPVRIAKYTSFSQGLGIFVALDHLLGIKGIRLNQARPQKAMLAARASCQGFSTILLREMLYLPIFSFLLLSPESSRADLSTVEVSPPLFSPPLQYPATALTIGGSRISPRTLLEISYWFTWSPRSISHTALSCSSSWSLKVRSLSCSSDIRRKAACLALRCSSADCDDQNGKNKWTRYEFIVGVVDTLPVERQRGGGGAQRCCSDVSADRLNGHGELGKSHPRD